MHVCGCLHWKHHQPSPGSAFVGGELGRSYVSLLSCCGEQMLMFEQ
ncbi:Uncharacterized protein TCM_004666 isoform 2 [Theobroma cacao]|uniref:Uncharacterized protein isoform 2 n=1 Tax=Theobroma cacao TaxID=3641 RepID=A0A061DQV3_THECC|nr:Uncharacterized protein TCM_004666 isoform 2 [Theobroma cacao]